MNASRYSSLVMVCLGEVSALSHECSRAGGGREDLCSQAFLNMQILRDENQSHVSVDAVVAFLASSYQSATVSQDH